jgi:hypothetical protein
MLRNGVVHWNADSLNDQQLHNPSCGIRLKRREMNETNTGSASLKADTHFIPPLKDVGLHARFLSQSDLAASAMELSNTSIGA